MQNAILPHGDNATHVLHVDADPSVQKESKQQLKTNNIEVEVVSSVDEALVKLKHQHYDAVISELEFTQKSGLDFLKQLNTMLNRPPFIIFTCKSNEDAAVNALNLGADGYIKKHGDAQTVYAELSQCITSLVSKSSLADGTEATIKEAEETFRSLVECTSDWIWQVDENAVYTYVSPKVQEILGYTAEEVIGKTPFDLMPKSDLDEVAPLFAGYVNRKEPFQAVYNWNVHKNGSLVLLESSGVPIIDSNGKMVGFRGIDRDVTKRKQTEDALIESEERNRITAEKLRVIGDLTRHDVRNKLGIITSAVYVMKKTYVNQPDLTRNLNYIDQAVKASTEILDFAQIYEHLGVTELVIFDVKKAVKEASEMFANLPFKVVNDCQGLTVLADSFLRQLIYNLIDNTRKYAQKASTARIHYEKTQSGELRLIYEDNGVGIPMANKPQLFKQGFTTGGGTGLGLFLCKKMIEVYGWQITEAGEPMQGAKFVVTIPQVNKNNRLNYKIAP